MAAEKSVEPVERVELSEVSFLLFYLCLRLLQQICHMGRKLLKLGIVEGDARCEARLTHEVFYEDTEENKKA